jgi:hypothetical protein
METSLENFDYNSVMTNFIKMVYKTEEDIIKQVLRQILGREPVLEDAKDLTKAYRTDISHTDYDLSYKNIPVGKVIFEFNGPSFSVTFTPNERYV